MQNRVIIYTDGAYSRKRNVGGYAFIVKYMVYENGVYILKKEGYDSKTVENTTTNRMELQAVVDGLNFLKRPCNIEVISDSTYIVDTINKWISSFVGGDKDRPNYDLMLLLYNAIKKHVEVMGTWIKGHSGNIDNEKVNELAQKAAGTFTGKHSFWED